MVAYSFQPMFAPAIKVGLGLSDLNLVVPKTHTIRARRLGRSRHAFPGERLQLFVRQRHPSGYKLGDAICTGVRVITLHFDKRKYADWVWLSDDIVVDSGSPRREPGTIIKLRSALDNFARSDGFSCWKELRDFWQRTHAVPEFTGLVIYWRPLTAEERADAPKRKRAPRRRSRPQVQPASGSAERSAD